MSEYEFNHPSEHWGWLIENVFNKKNDSEDSLEVPKNISENFKLKLSSSNIDVLVKALNFCLQHKVIVFSIEDIQKLESRNNVDIIVKSNIDSVIKSINIVKNDPNIKELAGITNSVNWLILFLEKLIDCRKFNSDIEYIG
jgi:hypothetical protein